MSGITLASDISDPISFQVKELIRPKALRSFNDSDSPLFAHIPLSDLVIECQVWGGCFDVSRVSELYSSTTHWILHKDFNTWKQSRIKYCHLLCNTQKPVAKRLERDNQHVQYLSLGRAIGPHLWFEVKLPVPVVNQKTRKMEQNQLLAVGVLPLIYSEERMVLKQGLQCVRLFPVGRNASQGPFVPLDEDLEIEYRLKVSNDLHRYQGMTWVDKQALNRLKSKIPVPDKFKPRGNFCEVPDCVVGHLIVELPRFSAEEVYLHFYQLNTPREERVSLPPIRQISPQLENSIKGKFTAKIPLETKRAYLSGVVTVRDHQLFCGYNKSGAIVEPVEEKYRQLSWNMEPSRDEVQRIQRIISYSLTHQLTEDERYLLWYYRKYLTCHFSGKALKKFLAAIPWDNETKKKEAIRVMYTWKDVHPQDAIEILNICVSQAPAEVYVFAVKLLSRLENLQIYLLELIQALKLDHKYRETGELSSRPLFELLLDISKKDFTFCNNFYWYLESEKSGETGIQIYGRFLDLLKLSLAPEVVETFKRQQTFIENLSDLHTRLFTMNGNLAEAVLRQTLETITFNPPLPLPMDPNVRIVGFVTTGCFVKKSNARPFILTFLKEDGGQFVVLYKKGDDLRQDMFFLQMLRLIDELYKTENFDLHLTPYRVLSTSLSRPDGFVEFVGNSTTLSEVEKDYKTGGEKSAIQGFLRKFNPNPNAPYGIDPTAMERFLRSCAGYCVVTYLFGVGDRHLHNLMILKSGGLFHIDFGFIFGKDPKPFNPPFKLSPSMVDGMGGKNSEHFERFTTYCCEAYNRVRSMGNVIIALASLMIEANIDDLDRGVDTIRENLEANFKFDLTDEEASREFITLIKKSANALLSRYVTDMAHEWAQYWQN